MSEIPRTFPPPRVRFVLTLAFTFTFTFTFTGALGGCKSARMKAAPTAPVDGHSADGHVPVGEVAEPVPPPNGMTKPPADAAAPPTGCAFAVPELGAAVQSKAVVQLAAGGSHTCANLGGKLICWGSNKFGELGASPSAANGAATLHRVEKVPAVATISAGGGGNGVSGHTCAVTADAKVWCWGQNSTGQLGDGTKTSRAEPMPVKDLGAADSVGAGVEHTCALLKDGSIWCWGANANGALGIEDRADQPEPVRTAVAGSANLLAVGPYHACARQPDGGLLCWGLNSSGPLGTGDRITPSVPTKVPGVSGVRTIAVGGATTCVTTAQGASCWGSNEFSQAGGDDGGPGAAVLRPRPVEGLGDVSLFALGGAHSCARRTSGAVVCWGSNGVQQLGSTGAQTGTPQIVAGVPEVTALAAGGGATFALTVAGEIWAWGDNREGRLGDGTKQPRPKPVCLLAPALARRR